MFSYIEKLNLALKEHGYDDEYIQICDEYAFRLLENNLPVIFDRNHFVLLLGTTKKFLGITLFFADKLYKLVKIPKKSGDYRQISIPTRNLKYIQKWILDNILNNMKVSEHSKGFVKKCSIVDNAKQHVNNECVITLDIKDFFPSITYNQVFHIFKYYGYTNELSYTFAKICTYNGGLPQGAPSSPYISNIICLKLDKRLSQLSNRIEANYTRYADDITISGSSDIKKCLPLIVKIIREEGFEINENKLRIQYSSERQIVTGLIVNEKLSVPQKKKRYLRQQIHYCKRFGVANHLEHIKVNKSNFKEHLYGLAYFIKMVEREKGEKFLLELDSITWDY